MVCKSLNKSGHGQNLDWMNFGSTHEGRDVIGFWMHGDASYTELRFVFKPMLHFYVDSPAPSLHGNNSEIGAKTVNIKV